MPIMLLERGGLFHGFIECRLDVCLTLVNSVKRTFSLNSLRLTVLVAFWGIAEASQRQTRTFGEFLYAEPQITDIPMDGDFGFSDQSAR